LQKLLAIETHLAVYATVIKTIQARRIPSWNVLLKAHQKISCL